MRKTLHITPIILFKLWPSSDRTSEKPCFKNREIHIKTQVSAFKARNLKLLLKPTEADNFVFFLSAYLDCQLWPSHSDACSLRRMWKWKFSAMPSEKFKWHKNFPPPGVCLRTLPLEMGIQWNLGGWQALGGEPTTHLSTTSGSGMLVEQGVSLGWHQTYLILATLVMPGIVNIHPSSSFTHPLKQTTTTQQAPSYARSWWGTSAACYSLEWKLAFTNISLIYFWNLYRIKSLWNVM